ncbi:MAG: hypothetical protein AAGA56_24485 [Myxococcota bacterium]
MADNRPSATIAVPSATATAKEVTSAIPSGVPAPSPAPRSCNARVDALAGWLTQLEKEGPSFWRLPPGVALTEVDEPARGYPHLSTLHVGKFSLDLDGHPAGSVRNLGPGATPPTSCRSSC